MSPIARRAYNAPEMFDRGSVVARTWGSGASTNEGTARVHLATGSGADTASASESKVNGVPTGS